MIHSCKKGRKNNIKHQLNLHVDTNGLLRCQGRFENTELTQATKYPKLLPKDTHFTRLIIQDAHCRILHSGVSQTLARVRQQYWIPHGRAIVKKTLKDCRVCRRAEGAPFAMPRMPDLPRECVARSHPFEYTGVDYFGPLYIKIFYQMNDPPPEQTEKRYGSNHLNRQKKRHGSVYLRVSLLHLELVEDMSAEEFILGLRRFIARRGTPRKIVLDNAKQFKTTKAVHKKVSEFATYQGIDWKYIVELAPWMGGFYERLIGLTKRALRKTIGNKRLTQGQLVTILAEVEVVINSRPLVYVDEDINLSPTLTPMDFLSFHTLHVIPDLTEEIDPEFDFTKRSSARQLLQSWKCGQKHLNQFWKLWRNEYLLSL